jgi:hypothetical protein
MYSEENNIRSTTIEDTLIHTDGRHPDFLDWPPQIVSVHPGTLIA